MDTNKTTAIIVAAGAGVRMKSPVRKQYLLLKNLPILAHTLSIFESCDMIGDVILVIPIKDFSFCKNSILPYSKFPDKIKLVPGGKERQDSVHNGLLSMDANGDDDRMVAIHDGVRPLVTADDIKNCIAAAHETGGAILGIPASDTLKKVHAGSVIRGTLNREDIWLAQTPQVFRHGLILKAHERAKMENHRGTDDASLVERIGGKVRVVPGSVHNMKITTVADLVLAEAIFRTRETSKG